MKDITVYDFIMYLEETNQLQEDLTISAEVLNQCVRDLREYGYKFDVTLDMLRFVERDMPGKLIVNNRSGITIKPGNAIGVVWNSEETWNKRKELNSILNKVWRKRKVMKNLDYKYKEVILAYCSEFAEKHELEFSEAEQSYDWLYHGVVFMSDYFINFTDMLWDIDNDVSVDCYEMWYDRSMECATMDITFPNYISYSKGAPHISDEKIQQFREQYNHIEVLKEQLKNEIDNVNHGPDSKDV